MTEFAVLTDRGILRIAAGDQTEAVRLAEGDGYRVLAVDGEPVVEPFRSDLGGWVWEPEKISLGVLPGDLYSRLAGAVSWVDRVYPSREEAINALRAAIATVGTVR